ncbi:MAG: maleylpyruvate isomerase N-terminal domain-containing protein [Acidimicrobiales bacterium]
MRTLFLEVAEVVDKAVSDQRVASAWANDSVLEHQTVGSVASHMARGAVWVVGDYLDQKPAGPKVDIDSAAQYFAQLSDQFNDEDHAPIRARSAEIAELGAEAVAKQLSARLDDLKGRLLTEPADRTLAVYAGLVMRLDDYLGTRIVEQVIHLDDIALSVGAEPWDLPTGASEFVLQCGIDIGRRRFGDLTMRRGLFRKGPDAALPVI